MRLHFGENKLMMKKYLLGISLVMSTALSVYSASDNVQSVDMFAKEYTAEQITLELGKADWWEYDATSAVKDQASTINCAAHAFASSLESALILHSGLGKDEVQLDEAPLIEEVGDDATAQAIFRMVTVASVSGLDNISGHKVRVQDWGLFNESDVPLSTSETYEDDLTAFSDNVKEALVNYGPLYANMFVGVDDPGEIIVPEPEDIDADPAWQALLLYSAEAVKDYNGRMAMSLGNSSLLVDTSYEIDYKGKHSVLITGWDDEYIAAPDVPNVDSPSFTSGFTLPETSKVWIIQNSWGYEWGDHGCGYVQQGCMNLGSWLSTTKRFSEFNTSESYEVFDKGYTSVLGYDTDQCYALVRYPLAELAKVVESGAPKRLVIKGFDVWTSASYNGTNLDPAINILLFNSFDRKQLAISDFLDINTMRTEADPAGLYSLDIESHFTMELTRTVDGEEVPNELYVMVRYKSEEDGYQVPVYKESADSLQKFKSYVSMSGLDGSWSCVDNGNPFVGRNCGDIAIRLRYEMDNSLNTGVSGSTWQIFK